MLSAMARELVERNGIGDTADSVWRLCCSPNNLHYPELKAMPSEPPLDRENVSQTLMKPAIQLPLF